MSFTQQVLLRYRSEGHLRFDLPDGLCELGQAAVLTEGLQAHEGIYRVDLSRSGKKLSIRYLPTVCDFGAVIRWLHAIIASLPNRKSGGSRAVARHTATHSLIVSPLARASFATWLRAKIEELRETAMALRIMVHRAMESGASTITRRPRWIKEFMNDLLMLYLIKLHWHHILTEWLPSPWTHRYEWAATIYLIYLSVQSRLPQISA